MKLKKLESVKTIKPFDCGDNDLNGFLMDDSRNYHQQFLAHTYIIENEFLTIDYFSLLTDKISKSDLDKNLWRKLRKDIPHEKHYDSYPAIKIGRLAISSHFKGMGIGTNILDAIKMRLSANKEYAACRFLTVDAYRAAVDYYLKNRFLPLLKEPPHNSPTVPLYFDLKKAMFK